MGASTPSHLGLVVSGLLSSDEGRYVGNDRKFPICNDPKFLTLGLSLKAYRAVLLALPTQRDRCEIRMLLKHYLDRGVSKAELSRRFGVNRRTIHNWVDTGQLDRDLAAGARGYSPRPPVAHKAGPLPAEGTRRRGITLERPCEGGPLRTVLRRFETAAGFILAPPREAVGEAEGQFSDEVCAAGVLLALPGSRGDVVPLSGPGRLGSGSRSTIGSIPANWTYVRVFAPSAGGPQAGYKATFDARLEAFSEPAFDGGLRCGLPGRWSNDYVRSRTG